MFQVDKENPIVKMCVEGIKHEELGEIEQAALCYRRAWESSTDDLERCIAAHYVARCEASAEERLRWNHSALSAALAVADERVEGFYASLHLNVGKSYEDLEQWAEAAASYDDAESAAQSLPEGPYRDTVSGAISRGQDRIQSRL